MRPHRWQQALITEQAAGFDVEHVHGPTVVELIDFAAVRSPEIFPFHLFHEDGVTQTIRVFHQGTVLFEVFSCYEMNQVQSFPDKSATNGVCGGKDL